MPAIDNVLVKVTPAFISDVDFINWIIDKIKYLIKIITLEWYSMSNITIHIDDQFMHKLVEDKLEKIN